MTNFWPVFCYFKTSGLWLLLTKPIKKKIYLFWHCPYRKQCNRLLKRPDQWCSRCPNYQGRFLWRSHLRRPPGSAERSRQESESAQYSSWAPLSTPLAVRTPNQAVSVCLCKSPAKGRPADLISSPLAHISGMFQCRLSFCILLDKTYFFSLFRIQMFPFLFHRTSLFGYLLSL